MNMHCKSNWLARRALVVSLGLAAFILLGRAALAQPQIVRWEIEGTVVDLGDADKIFTNVRLGDPVRGFLTYNPALSPTIGDDLYEHQPFVVAGLTIQNPRDDSEFEFEADKEKLAFVEVLNDASSASVGMFDAITAVQTVASPQGYTGFAPVISIDMYGPPNVLPDSRLPETLNLDDWPDATIAFYDIFWFEYDIGDPSSYVIAEIHTLTPVTPPIAAGDFNVDGLVDAADYVVWRDGLSTTYTEADYDLWRAHFGQTAASGLGAAADSRSSATAAVPEPITAAMVLVGVALLGWRRRCRIIPAPAVACPRGALFRNQNGMPRKRFAPAQHVWVERCLNSSARETSFHAVKLRGDDMIDELGVWFVNSGPRSKLPRCRSFDAVKLRGTRR